MITYEEALQKAREIKQDIDNASEYENGYVFGFSGDSKSYGGYGRIPVVIRKSDGQVMRMPEFLVEGMGTLIRDIELKA